MITEPSRISMKLGLLVISCKKPLTFNTPPLGRRPPEAQNFRSNIWPGRCYCISARFCAVTSDRVRIQITDSSQLKGAGPTRQVFWHSRSAFYKDYITLAQTVQMDKEYISEVDLFIPHSRAGPHRPNFDQVHKPTEQVACVIGC